MTTPHAIHNFLYGIYEFSMTFLSYGCCLICCRLMGERRCGDDLCHGGCGECIDMRSQRIRPASQNPTQRTAKNAIFEWGTGGVCAGRVRYNDRRCLKLNSLL